MKKYFLLPLLATSSLTLVAQHHQVPPQKDTANMRRSMDMHQDHMVHDMRMNKDGQMHMHDRDMPGMTHSYSLHLPMSRNGSGTSWVPDETPMYMYMTGKKAMWMLHGNVFLRYTNTDIFNKGSRGASTVDAPNWLMVMMNKPVGRKGLISAKAMLSFDPLTEGEDGYPLLLQSGETYKGRKLVDRQHPHDLFSELSVGYTYGFNKNTDAFVYIGYPGEPALGVPAFMHRIAAMNNPDAPLGHHWQDATHITFGVATVGFRYRQLKIEGSSFTGREPGENRYNFDKARFDSYSYRFSYNPSSSWAFQFSQGFIHAPEKLESGVNVTRTTASALFSRKITAAKQHDAALVWGYNQRNGDHNEHSLLAEENYRFGKNAVYGRYEFVQKSTEELDLVNELGNTTFNVHALTGGYNYNFWNNNILALVAGLQASVYAPAKGLQGLYGNSPVSFQVYLQLRPAKLNR